MQSLAGQHCDLLWYHNVTQHCIFPSTFSAGKGAFHLRCWLWAVFICPSLFLSAPLLLREGSLQNPFL